MTGTPDSPKVQVPEPKSSRGTGAWGGVDGCWLCWIRLASLDGFFFTARSEKDVPELVYP